MTASDSSLSTADPDSPEAPQGGATIDLAVRDGRWTDALPDVEVRCAAAARAALAGAESGPAGLEVSLVLADDAFVAELNETWRNRPGPTNVLSFPAAADTGPAVPGPRLLGDVVIAFDTTREEAAGAGKPLADHLAHLVVHGVLHLLGHDHEDPADAAVMEAAETEILARLGVADPYAGTEPLEPDSEASAAVGAGGGTP